MMFDILRNKISEKINARFYNSMLKDWIKIEFDSILDVGSGRGFFIKYVGKEDALGFEQDKLKYKTRITDKVVNKLFTFDTNLDRKFDVITLMQSIYYLDDTLKCLENMWNLLNDDGYIIITTVNHESKWMKEWASKPPFSVQNVITKEDYESLEDKIGLKLVRYTRYRNNLQIASIVKARIFLVDVILLFLGIKKVGREDASGDAILIILKKTK